MERIDFKMLTASVAVCVALFMLSANAATVTYTADNSIFANPERGFFHTNGLSQSSFQNARNNENITLIKNYYRIDNYRNSDLPQSVLDGFSADLATCRSAGAKMIPRFTYNFGMDADAPMSSILRHIAQLRPIFRANQDVIALFEAGFIGAWGEWHSSTNGLATTDARRQVLFALLEAFLPDRMVALRYNYHKRAIFGDTPLGPDSAFSGSNRARTGAHADCLGASAEDWGTYDPSSASDIEMQKSYLNLDNRYLPQVGETCNVSSYSTCNPMTTDLARMRWDALNIDFEPTVLASWVSGGCMDDVKRKLGYRFRMISSDLPTSLGAGNTFTLSIQMINEGWGCVYNPRGVEIVLRNQSGGAKYVLNIDNGKGNRLWLPGPGETKTLTIAGGIPLTIPAGSYDVILNLPDAYASLHDRVEYSIRLANTGVWESSTGYNKLNQTLQVSASGGGTPYTGPNWFGLNGGVVTPVAPTITGPATLGNAGTDVAFSATFTASGEAPITWSVSTGTLPPGMNLNATTGVYSGTPTTAGNYTFTIKATNSLGNNTKSYTQSVVVIAPAFQGPYGGTSWPVPGIIQAEDYDIGGEGIAYHDLVAGNELGAYRTDSVDVEATTDVDGAYQLGHTGDGEWLEYTVNVATTGVYSLDARVASALAMQFHVYVDGIDVATVDAASTGSWTTWTTVSKSGISLTSGKHVIRFAFTSLGFCVNWLRFTGSTPVLPLVLGKAAQTPVVNTTYFSLDGKKISTRIMEKTSQPKMIVRHTIINGRIVSQTKMLMK